MPVTQIHPEIPHLHRHPSPLSAAREFVELIRSLNEEDYGDYMRKVNAGLHSLREAIEREPIDIRNWVERMQSYVQFNPNWHVASTRLRLLADAEYFLSLLTERTH